MDFTRCVENAELHQRQRVTVTISVRRSTQEECQNKHLTSRRFTYGTVVESTADFVRD